LILCTRLIWATLFSPLSISSTTRVLNSGVCFLLALIPLIFILAQETPPFRVYLAFEDGPTDVYTPEILDILAQYKPVPHSSLLALRSPDANISCSAKFVKATP
jgi:hypothetical protein